MFGRIALSVEDRFVIVGVREAQYFLPNLYTTHRLLNAIFAIDRDYSLVIDVCGLPHLYPDVRDFISELVKLSTQENIMVLVRGNWEKTLVEYVRGKQSRHYTKLHYITKDVPKLWYETFSLAAFGEPRDLDNIEAYFAASAWATSREPGLPKDFKIIKPDQKDQDEFLDFEKFQIELRNKPAEECIGIEKYRIALLYEFIKKHAKNSLLNEFAFSINKEGITVTPYHSYALYETCAPEGKQSIIARPGVIARRTGSILLQELKEFEAIVNKLKVKEIEIQNFLNQHRHFFHGLNYKNVYPQIVLERAGKSVLIPDFICEPIGSEWCEILDLKIPITKPIDVGGKDRSRLAAVIADGIAQLREYAAWFDDGQNFKSFRKKYGLSIYKPKLKLIVGRDPRNHDEKQLRRMMTAYADVDVLTYDEFLRICRSRLLI